MKKIPWWLWLNVLGLDAPLIAIVWQRFLSQAWHMHMKFWPTIVLGLGVWTIYLADRCADSYTTDASKMRDRHLFARLHRLWMWPLAVITGIATLWLALTRLLWERELIVALSGVVMLAYLLLWHRLKNPRLEKGYLKEIMVGMIFAAGVAGMAGVTQCGLREYIETFIFGFVCTVNCLLIRTIEGAPRERGWKKMAIAGLIAGFVILGFGQVLGDHELVMATLAGSLWALIFLLSLIRRINTPLARVLADAALLTPLAAWLVKCLN